MEQNALFTTDCADFAHGLDRSDLVIAVHDGDQHGLIGDRFAKLIKIDQSVLAHGQVSHPATMFFQSLTGVQHRFVLGRGSDDMVALLGIHLRHTFNCQIVRFRGAAGEDDLFGRGANQIGDLFAALFHGFLRDPAEAVIAAGGVAKILGEIRQHGLKHTGIHARGRVIIEINRKLQHCSLRSPPAREYL